MDVDLNDVDGMLDRGKVIAEFDKIFARLPIPLGAPIDGIKAKARQDIIDLIDQAIDHSFMDGMDF